MVFLIAALMLCILATIAVVAFAWRKGGRDERAAAVTITLGVAASQFASLFGEYWRGPEYWVMAVDTAALIAFLFIVRRSERFWPIWAAASQLVATITHIAPMVYTSIAMEAYATTQPFWLFPILVVLAIGTWNHHRATR